MINKPEDQEGCPDKNHVSDGVAQRFWNPQEKMKDADNA
jgi:hypothetical protein